MHSPEPWDRQTEAEVGTETGGDRLCSLLRGTRTGHVGDGLLPWGGVACDHGGGRGATLKVAMREACSGGVGSACWLQYMAVGKGAAPCTLPACHALPTPGAQKHGRGGGRA